MKSFYWFKIFRRIVIGLFVMFYKIKGDTYTYSFNPTYFADFIIFCYYLDFYNVVIKDAMNWVDTFIFSYLSSDTSELVKNILVTLCFYPIRFR